MMQVIDFFVRKLEILLLRTDSNLRNWHRAEVIATE